MSLIALVGVVAVLALLARLVSLMMRGDNRRRNRLELAFYRARSQRLVANGIRGNRF